MGENGIEAEKLGGMFARLIDDGRRVAKAEVAVHVAAMHSRADAAKGGVALLAAAYLLVHAAIVVLLIGFTVGMTRFVGPVAAGLIVALVTLVIAGLCAKAGIARISAAPGPRV